MDKKYRYEVWSEEVMIAIDINKYNTKYALKYAKKLIKKCFGIKVKICKLQCNFIGEVYGDSSDDLINNDIIIAYSA